MKGEPGSVRSSVISPIFPKTPSVASQTTRRPDRWQRGRTVYGERKDGYIDRNCERNDGRRHGGIVR